MSKRFTGSPLGSCRVDRSERCNLRVSLLCSIGRPLDADRGRGRKCVLRASCNTPLAPDSHQCSCTNLPCIFRRPWNESQGCKTRSGALCRGSGTNVQWRECLLGRCMNLPCTCCLWNKSQTCKTRIRALHGLSIVFLSPPCRSSTSIRSLQTATWCRSDTHTIAIGGVCRSWHNRRLAPSQEVPCKW